MYPAMPLTVYAATQFKAVDLTQSTDRIMIRLKFVVFSVRQPAEMSLLLYRRDGNELMTREVVSVEIFIDHKDITDCK